MKKNVITIIFILLLIPIFLVTAYITHTISGNIPKQVPVKVSQKDECLQKHPYKLLEGISICDTISDFKDKFPNSHKHFSYEHPEEMFKNKYISRLKKPKDGDSENAWNAWNNNQQKISSVEKLKKNIGTFNYYLYKIFPQAIPVHSASYASVYDKDLNKYFTPNDPENFVLETKLYNDKATISKNRSQLKNYSLVKMNLNKNLNWPPSKISYSATLYNGTFDYEKYYDDLVTLNGKPLSKKHVINSPLGGNYLTACWGNCITDEGIDYDEYYCEDNNPESSCMLISFFTQEKSEQGTHSSNINVYIR